MMTILWDSWDEFVAAVHPVEIRHEGCWRMWLHSSSFERTRKQVLLCEEIREAAHCLKKLGVSQEDRRTMPPDPLLLHKAKGYVMRIARCGEELLLLHKRLANSESSRGFRDEHDIMEHWDRYSKSKRVFFEVNALLTGTHALLKGYEEIAEADRRFIVDSLELPDILREDFTECRDLFSQGFDDLGVFVAGRGLEAVLREVLRRRKVTITNSKGKAEAASEVDLADMIAAMYQLRWRKGQVRVIDKQTSALLQYVRTVRNGGAHSSFRSVALGTQRQIAETIAQAANRLWSVAEAKERLLARNIQKTW